MKNIILNILDNVKGTSLSEDGEVLKECIKPFFEHNVKINLSFKGVTGLSSNFFKDSFGYFIDKYGYDKFIEIINPINISKSVSTLLQKFIEEN